MVDNIVKLTEALAKLIGSFAWPLIALILIFRFAPTLKTFLSSISEGSLKGWGIEATAKRLATDAIVTADIKSIAGTETPAVFQAKVGVGKSYRLADLLTSSLPLAELKGKFVLWVGNKVSNVYEKRALTELGLKVFGASSTDAVMNLLATEHVDAIISDMRGDEGEIIGNEILAKLAEHQLDVPLIIYSNTNTAEQEAEAARRGAFGSTNSAADLILLITTALRGTRSISFASEFSKNFRSLQSRFSKIEKP
jgi:CheY-like chemotaxis protein